MTDLEEARVREIVAEMLADHMHEDARVRQLADKVNRRLQNMVEQVIRDIKEDPEFREFWERAIGKQPR